MVLLTLMTRSAIFFYSCSNRMRIVPLRLIHLIEEHISVILESVVAGVSGAVIPSSCGVVIKPCAVLRHRHQITKQIINKLTKGRERAKRWRLLLVETWRDSRDRRRNPTRIQTHRMLACCCSVSVVFFLLAVVVGVMPP